MQIMLFTVLFFRSFMSLVSCIFLQRKTASLMFEVVEMPHFYNFLSKMLFQNLGLRPLELN